MVFVRFDRVGAKGGRYGRRSTLVLPAGKNKLYVTGRDGRIKFPPGRYRVTITRVDSATNSWRSPSFRVVTG
jgi:hypothetical protein